LRSQYCTVDSLIDSSAGDSRNRYSFREQDLDSLAIEPSIWRMLLVLGD